MKYRVLNDADVAGVLGMHDAVHAIEGALRAHAQGRLIAPPRFHVEAGNGALVFTVGAAARPEQVIGFRAYGSYQPGNPDADQLVAVFDSDNGQLKGIVIGSLIGALRTGAIGGVAIKHMSRPESAVLGVLGSGRQARTQLEAAAAVRDFRTVKVFSPDVRHRTAFAADVQAELGIPVEAVASPEQAVRGADVLICATTSRAPAFSPEWLQPGTHVNTVGPKFKRAHELDFEVAAQSRVIASDSIAQINAYPRPFFLLDTADGERIVELSDIVSGRREGRLSANDITLFCSVGLAGTEVVVANEAIERVGRTSR